MKTTKYFAGTVGVVFCSALLVLLTGYAANGEGPRADGAYVTIQTTSDFYEPLSSYGQWQVVGSYGRCWIPGGVAVGWSPYSNGYWQYTDAGWYWATDEPWGWATYHYGSWDMSPQYGWYWVPQTQWAPAWVSWREGGGYVGWAPMGPSGRAEGSGGTPRGYVFVQERSFLDPVSPTTVIVNTTVINKTAVNKGPGTAVIEQASGRKVQPVAVRQLRSQDEAKIVAKRPTATPTVNSEKAVPTPTGIQAEKTIPAPAPQPVEKRAVTTAAPQPAATQNDSQQADDQKRAAKLSEENVARQEKAAQAQPEKIKPVPAPVEFKPETRPDAKVEPKPEPDRPVAAQEPADHKSDKDEKKQD